MAEIEREAILTPSRSSAATGGGRPSGSDIGLRTLQRKLKEYRGEAGDDDDEDLGEDTAT